MDLADGKIMSWTKTQIESEKEKIRDWLENFHAPKAKLSAILSKLHGNLEDDGTELQLQTFLLSVFALAHHLRNGGMSISDIDKMANLADTLLRIQGVDSPRSRIAFLAGDLHLMLSQIYWKSGDQWKACWEQLLSRVLGGPAEENTAHGYLALANRALRLGQAANALRWIETAKKNGLGSDGWWSIQSGLKQLMIFRLQARFQEAETLESQLLAHPKISADERTEIQWEKLSRIAHSEGDPSLLLQSVKKGKQHHDVEFAIEAFLWSRAVSSTRWMKQYPNFRKLVYSSQIKTRKNDPLFQALTVLEGCYDTGIPMPRRLRDLGEVLGNLNLLVNLNHELLVRAASLRWLIRSSSPEAECLARTEYESLCRKITEGASADVLNAFDSSPLISKAG